MVDITAKKITKRTAKAGAIIELGKKAYRLLVEQCSPKGDVLETARVAGIMAAKSTPQILPLCHPLELGKACLDFKLNPQHYSIIISAEINYHGRTGVEMEALTAVSVAALTIYDMMKWADKGMVIKEVKLLSKSGGKSGDYRRKS